MEIWGILLCLKCKKPLLICVFFYMLVLLWSWRRFWAQKGNRDERRAKKCSGITSALKEDKHKEYNISRRQRKEELSLHWKHKLQLFLHVITPLNICRCQGEGCGIPLCRGLDGISYLRFVAFYYSIGSSSIVTYEVTGTTSATDNVC